jgi:hypothetical protein
MTYGLASTKRNYLRIVMAVVYIVIVSIAYLTHQRHAGLWMFPAVGLICFLNLQFIRFCDQCGSMVVIKDFAATSVCRKCGGSVRPSYVP